MADISDITAYLAGVAENAVYPSGTSAPSIAGMDCRIYEGWPIAEQLDLDLAGQVLSNGVPVARSGGKVANISIYITPGGSLPYQVLDNTYTVAAPVFGMTVSVSGNTITVSGSPNAGEFLTVVCDRQFIYSKAGNTAAAILSALATSAQANYSGVTVSATQLTIPTDFSFEVRQGGVGTLAKVTSRERAAVMVTVWAPDHASRTTLAKAIDVAIKNNIIVTLPDTSDAKITYARTNISDARENVTIYRRDLIYDVEYATLEEFPGVTITSVQATVTNPTNSPETIATT